MQKLFEEPLPQTLAALCGVALALSLHLLTNRLRSQAPRLLKWLGWVAIVLTVCLTPLALLATAQFGASATLLGFVTFGLALVAFVAFLHDKQGVIPLSVAFLHLMAEALGAALILVAVSANHYRIANLLCGANDWERYGQCIEQVGILIDRIVVPLLLSLLILETARPFTSLMARRGIASLTVPER